MDSRPTISTDGVWHGLHWARDVAPKDEHVARGGDVAEEDQMHVPRRRCRHSSWGVRWSARWSARSVALAALVGLAVQGLAACGTATGNAYYPPADWHDITPPTGEQITSYAISPDVPGLIVACIGDQTAHTSTAPMGPARIWRTRDAGAHWQVLSTTQFSAGCEIAMPAGGHGTVFAENLFGAQESPKEFITVSHDAGDTWQTLATDANYPLTLEAVFTLLGAGAYRGGQFYSLAAIAPGTTDNALPGSFFASADDGRTWSTLDASADPLAQQGYFPTGLTPDYHSPGAWYRLMARSDRWLSAITQHGAGRQRPVPDLSPTVLEHSSDGGRTWTALGAVGPRGQLSYGESLAEGGALSARLATTPGQPNSLCAGFNPVVQGRTIGRQGAEVQAAGAALAAVGTTRTTPRSKPLIPYQPPHDVALYSSDDRGATWRGATVAHSGLAAQPVVAVDAHGGCYTAASTGPGFPTSDELDQVSTTVWHLGPVASASAQQIARITRLDITTLGVTVLQGQSAPRLLAVVHPPQPEIICQDGICPAEVPHPPHLIWQVARDA